jgi:hypothetical protein
MTIIAPGGPRAPQPTPAASTTLGPGVRPTARGRRRAETRPDRSTTVGIVFVHGIGSQRPGETLLDWSRPLIRLLTEWRIAHDLPPDPVVASDIDFTGASLPSIELAIPAGPVGADDEPAATQRWILTEAWWASRVQPPSLGSMTSWLRQDFGRVVAGIRTGFDARTGSDARRRELLRLTDAHPQLVAAGLDDRRWAWIDRLDRLQARLLSIALGAAWIVGATLLLPYAALRAIPVKALRDAVGLGQLDAFLVDWFGDMRILLHDAAQAANIRAQLVGAIDGLVARGCGPIVVIAHSGGAVVSFTTLTDPGHPPLPVTKLITLGQGLDLAWRLENAWCGLPAGDRLGPSLGSTGWPTRWVDIWASYDPATGGPLDPPAGIDAHPTEVAVRNRMSLLDDHGTYWENDEEVLIPLLRQLDTPDGPPSRSRFFRDRLGELIRIEIRRQRVGVLAAWRWVCLVAAAVAIGGATLHAALLHGDRLRRLGQTMADAWGAIPGGSLLASPLDWIAGLAAWPGWLPTLGEWLLGVLLVGLVYVILTRVGIGRWVAWDERERWLTRSEPPQPSERRGPAVQGAVLVLVAALIALLVALS